VHLLNPTPEQRHRQRAYYLANMTMIDEKVGRILSILEEKGYLEDAVVIFTSDHGDCLGDHGHSQKWTMYDTITRVPTMFWSPGRFSGGKRVSELFQMMDIGPTILELAGVEVPSSFEAISMLPALKDPNSAEGRDHVFSEHGRDGNLQGTELVMMTRSRDWKLVCFVDDPKGQLFNLEQDPEELHNLWDDPDAQAKKRELLEVMRRWFMESVYRTREWGAPWR
jgi:arylsulfatase A-like enzyme